MERMGFYIDMTTCIGCRTCQIACKDKNNLDAGILYRSVKTFETGSYPNPGWYHYSAACYHCETPKCVRFCPTNALYVAGDGTVQYEHRLCITCKYCVQYCPYGAVQYINGKARIGKCDSCKDLRDKGENPACVDACVTRSIEWGAISELRAKHSGEELTADLPILPPSEGTNPMLLIHPKKAALDKNYRPQRV